MRSADEPLMVPIKIDDVVVGTASVDDKNNLKLNVSAQGVSPHLKELILLKLVDSISLGLDYVPEYSDRVISRGHLRLVRAI